MATDAVTEYEKLVEDFSSSTLISAGQMFGKVCLKVDGKAFVAQHKDSLVFKLSGETHAQALALKDAQLWDPSGKGRAMKEWIALPAIHHKKFKALANAALDYVQSLN